MGPFPNVPADKSQPLFWAKKFGKKVWLIPASVYVTFFRCQS